MATRTAKGTTSSKTSSTTLTLSNVSCTTGDALIVMVGNQTTNVPTSVAWGTRELTLSRQRTNTTSAHVGSVWIARNIVNTATRNLVVTWGTAIVAKCMAAVTLDAGHIRDQYASNTQTASTAPTTTATPTQTDINDFCIGILVSEGPSSDTAPTLSGGFTAGQRVGTVGAPPVSNVTLLEGYKQLSSDSTGQTLSGTGATSADWVNVLITYRPIKAYIPLDQNGTELVVGDTVSFEGSNSTISSITLEQGIPTAVLVLADGRQIHSYYAVLVK